MKNATKLVNAVRMIDIIGKFEDINANIIVKEDDSIILQDTVTGVFQEFFKREDLFGIYVNYMVDSIMFEDDSITLKVRHKEDLY